MSWGFLCHDLTREWIDRLARFLFRSIRLGLRRVYTYKKLENFTGKVGKSRKPKMSICIGIFNLLLHLVAMMSLNAEMPFDIWSHMYHRRLVISSTIAIARAVFGLWTVSSTSYFHCRDRQQLNAQLFGTAKATWPIPSDLVKAVRRRSKQRHLQSSGRRHSANKIRCHHSANTIRPSSSCLHYHSKASSIDAPCPITTITTTYHLSHPRIWIPLGKSCILIHKDHQYPKIPPYYMPWDFPFTGVKDAFGAHLRAAVSLKLAAWGLG